MRTLILLSSLLAIASQQGLAADCLRINEIEDYVASNLAPAGSQCEVFIGLENSVGVSCFWAHPFRSAKADDFFEQTWNEVTSCRQGETSLEQGPVNHPDSYQQRELSTGGGVYRVARKDKGVEQRTLIFLSYENSGS